MTVAEFQKEWGRCYLCLGSPAGICIPCLNYFRELKRDLARATPPAPETKP